MATDNRDYNFVRAGKYSHNTELGVFQMKNIFSYQSTWGTSQLRDDIVNVGSGSTSLENGAIRLSTGSTTGSSVTVDTRRLGEYQPGKTVEAGAGAKIISALTGDQLVQIGPFDDFDGFFFEITADDLKVVLRRDGVDTKFSRKNEEFNIDLMDGSRDCAIPADQPDGYKAGNPSWRTFDPTKQYLWNVRFSYYGVGPAVFYLSEAGDITNTFFINLDEMLFTRLHIIQPEEFPSTQNPNTPIRVHVENGTTTDDVIVDLGGRRYDVLGDFQSEVRFVGDYRHNQTVGTTALVPLIAFQKKSVFPSGTNNNSVNSAVSSFYVSSDEDLVVYIFEGGTLSGGSGLTTPQNYPNAETSLQVDRSATAIDLTGAIPIYGPFIIDANNARNSSPSSTSDKGIRVPFPFDQPVTLVAQSLGASATVSSTLIIEENR